MSSSRPRIHPRHLLLALGAILLVLATASALAFQAVQTAPADPWRPDGLKGTIVHFLAPAHHRPGVIFAAAGNGVGLRDARGHWRLVLSADTVWSVDVLADDRTVIAGDEAGNVDISHDAGGHWIRRPVSVQAVYAVASPPNDAPVILAGAGGGLYRSTDAGAHWRRTFSFPNGAGAAFAWLPGSRTTVFAGAVAGGTGGATQVYISRDAGTRWQLFGRGLGSRAGIMALAAGPAGYVYAGTMGNTIWRIAVSGSSWHHTAAGIPPGQHVAGIAFVPGRPSRLYVGTLGAGTFVSRDSGAHWQGISGGLPSSNGDRIVLSLAYSGLNRTLFAGTTDGVYSLKP
jgi:hypothetical protein